MAMVEEEKETLEEKYSSSIISLSKTDAFKIYCRVLQGQIVSRQKQLMSKPIITEEDRVQHNRLIAEIDGIELAIKLPLVMEARIEDEKTMQELEGEKNGTSR